MRKLLLLFFSGLLANGLWGQTASKLDAALRHLQEKHPAMGLEATDFKDMVVTFESTDARGISYLYLNQTVNGFPIKNAILNFTFSPQGKVAFVGNTFIGGKDKKVVNNRVSYSAEKAFEAAADHLGYSGIKAPAVTQRNGDKTIFAPSALTDNLVTAEMKYDLNKEGKLVPVWELTIDMKDNADYWEIRMNAADGSFVSKNNLTVYCSHHHGKYAKHENCEAHAVQQMKSQTVKVSDALTGNATYRVYALPAESPSHGAYTLVTDPHFPEVSPFGWHDTNGVEGPEYTITRGNNANAYTDKNDDDSEDNDVAQPDGGDDLIFDFPHDQSKEPVESPLAAQTNLFYMVNMMHDISALYGFDEEWGNFQAKNYSNKGAGNDYVLAQAFDGFGLATPKTDNANFSTPSDGGNGRMQMFLWNAPGGGLRIDSPDAIKGFIDSYGTADFGDPVPLSTEAPIVGSVVIAKDIDLSNPTACCKTITTDLTGKIALIDRGLCTFSQKAKLAEDKGAIAVIICNIPGVNGGTGEEISNMTAGTVTPNKVVTVFLKKSDCDKIRFQLNQEIDVVMTIQEAASTGPRYLDGAFDNGIIAHEFAHGISTRLTGGPANSGCLNNGEQMGEGWSDFFSLITTVEPGDKGTDIRGIGTYATGEATSGGGIRRFPYTTDMTYNPQTFDDIKGTENSASPCNGCHARGEIWTDCLWDLYWALVDKYGYDANWRNFESGNAKTVTLVIQAMKMQGCNPGFIRGRDAILAADTILFGGVNGNTIWDVFARRGLGFYADGGDANNFNDGVENFDTNPYAVALLKVKKDNLPLVKPGEEVTVHMSTVSHIPATQSGVTIVDNLPPDFTYIDGTANVPATVTGSDIRLSLGEVAFNQTNDITYKMRAGDKKSLTLAIYGFEGFEDQWQIDGETGTSSFFQTDVAYKNGETSFYIYEEETEIDQFLISPDLDVVGQNPALRFWHRFDTEVVQDGGFLEISTDGGNVWQLIKDGFIKNGYNSELSYTTFAIPSLKGFSGTTGGEFIDTYLDLSPWKGQTIKVRFRFGTNVGGVSSEVLRGWFIDDVEVMDLLVYETIACVANSDNANGSCSELRKIVIDSDGVVSSKDVTNNLTYAVYPNPAHDYVVVELAAKKAGAAKIQVFTADGRMVYNQTTRTNEGRNVHNILTHTLQPGVYLIQVQTAEGRGVQRVVIQ